MLHILVNERHKKRVFLIGIVLTTIGHVVDLDRFEAADKLPDAIGILGLLGTVAQLYAMQTTHLEHGRAQLGHGAGIAIHLDAIEIAGVQVAVAIAVAHVDILRHLVEGGKLGVLLRIVHIVIDGIVVALAIADIITLVLRVALGTILHADATDILGHFHHLCHHALERDGCLLTAEHIAEQLDRYLVSLSVVAETHAKGVFQ